MNEGHPPSIRRFARSSSGSPRRPPSRLRTSLGKLPESQFRRRGLSPLLKFRSVATVVVADAGPSNVLQSYCRRSNSPVLGLQANKMPCDSLIRRRRRPAPQWFAR